MPDRYPLDQSLKNSADVMEDAARAATDAVDEARQTIADTLSTTKEYVRNFDGKRMLANVERVVRDNPGPSLVIAAAFGFVIGRALTRD
jgi:ElaB/YqjD/DUF883 family membrane-anchored ribosome-binding protein